MNRPWRIVRLGDYLEFVTSGSRGWSEYVRATGSRFIRIQNVGRNELILDDIAYVQPPPGAETERTLVQSGDVLLSITADLGRTAVIPAGFGPAHINQHLALLRIRDFDPHFVSAFIGLGPGRQQLLRLDRGGVKSGLNFDDIRSINVPLAPMSEQRRIAAILDKADAIRRLRRESVRVAEKLLSSTFLEMFGEPVTNPKGWEVKQLRDVCDVAGGLQVTTARAGNPISIPYLRVANVFRDRLDLQEVKNILVTQSEADRVALVKGDVLVVEGHGNPEELGRAAVWTGAIAPCAHQNHLIRVRADSRRLRPIFLSALLNSSSGRAQMLRLGKTTSGLNTISTNNVRTVQLLLPPLAEQEAFERRVLQTRELSNCLGSGERQSRTLFDSLLHRAFRGELTSSESAPSQLSIFSAGSKHS